MNDSNSTINPESSILIENLSLDLWTDFYQISSWRDAFIEWTHNLVSPRTNRVSLPVLREINLNFRHGERVGILGVNGSGKTSLCRCIAGIYKPTSGRTIVSGKLRAIFDSSVGIYPELTGRENAQLLAELIYPHEIRRSEALNEGLEFSELGRYLDAPFKNYSNGMKARLCLSIASSIPSPILILDEVFEGADLFFSDKISKRMLEMIEKSSITLFVSHSPENIRRSCNRVIILSLGKIIYDGAVEDGLAAYMRLGSDQQTSDPIIKGPNS